MAICAFWQVYDSIVPLILKNTFDVNDTVSGFIMALDNILALFLLPFFGSLSDRTKTRTLWHSLRVHLYGAASDCKPCEESRAFHDRAWLGAPFHGDLPQPRCGAHAGCDGETAAQPRQRHH